MRRDYCRTVRSLAPDEPRWRFEIEADGIHIGWVSAYTDLNYVPNEEQIPAIGIDIPHRHDRGHGYGKAALLLFVDYFRKLGYQHLYTQTWSGNTPMIKLAESLGFRERSALRSLPIYVR